MSPVELDLMEAIGKIHGKSLDEILAMQRGMAIMIAEHEIMKKRLAETEEIYDEIPARWRESGEPIVDLEAVLQQFIKDRENV